MLDGVVVKDIGEMVVMVGVAQLVEPRIVIPVVVGSSPIVHPKLTVLAVWILIKRELTGPLAQLVEQLTLNQ